MTESKQLEICKNCGSSIGRLETAYIINDHVVCEKCRFKVQKRKSKKFAIIIIACLGVLAIILVMHKDDILGRSSISINAFVRMGSGELVPLAGETVYIMPRDANISILIEAMNGHERLGTLFKQNFPDSIPVNCNFTNYNNMIAASSNYFNLAGTSLTDHINTVSNSTDSKETFLLTPVGVSTKDVLISITDFKRCSFGLASGVPRWSWDQLRALRNEISNTVLRSTMDNILANNCIAYDLISVNGDAQLVLPAGEYYVVAFTTGSRGDILWAEPISIARRKPVSVLLRNENAIPFR